MQIPNLSIISLIVALLSRPHFRTSEASAATGRPRLVLPPMSAPYACQSLFDDLTSRFAPFTNAFTFHVHDLGKDGNNRLAHTPPNCFETLHFEFAVGRLNIQRIAPQAIQGINAGRFALAHLRRQLLEAGR